jgi:hypothetical protein
MGLEYFKGRYILWGDIPYPILFAQSLDPVGVTGCFR